nr:hypothetical protein [uncultured Limnohabitans sp.]
MNDNLVHQLFDKCIAAYSKKQYVLMADVLKEISTIKLQPKARVLYERLRVLADQKQSIHISEKVIVSAELADIGVIILIGSGDPSALGKSIESIECIREKGISVHCLLLECLPFGTDVVSLNDQDIPQLPVIVCDKLNNGTLDYVVEYGYTNKALRRAIRCAGGRYVCFLREGDELSLDGSEDKSIPQGYDLLIASPSSSSTNRLKNISHHKYEFTSFSALLAAGVFYDGALLVDRDYLDDMLGFVKYDSENNYFGYLNEILSVELTLDASRVKFLPNIVCLPSLENSNEHIQRIKSYTLFCIESRREKSARKLEPQAEQLISELLHVARDVFTNDSIQPNSINLTDGLQLAQLGKLSEPLKMIIRWHAQELREIALAKNKKEFKSLIINKEVHPKPVLSFVSSIFKGQKLLHSYLTDISRQTVFNQSDLIVVSPQPNLIQDLLVKIFELSNQRVRLIQLNEDPGIYECWNIAVKSSQAEFITNANLDDRRTTDHAEKMLDVMRRTSADVASSAICITNDILQISEFSGDLQSLRQNFKLEEWFSAPNEEESEKALNDFFMWNNSGEVVQCMNFPHCMPVWRRSIHDKFGYFNENENGTYADFALWLKAASSNAKFVHLTNPYGLYYVDPNSHNRRNASQKTWQNIVRKYLPSTVKITSSSHVVGGVNNVKVEKLIKSVDGIPKINFGMQISQNFGKHRSGWTYALAGLEALHDPSASLYCDAFIEKKFVWGGDPGDGGSGPVVPYSSPWIGFVHVPPYVPSWFQSEQSNQRIFSRKSWLKSLEHCQGLFTLTEYHRQFLLKTLNPKFPISKLYHPTEFPDLNFDFNKYKANNKKRIVQIGWWLRKLSAIKDINTPNHTPTLLGKSDWTKSMLIYSEARLAPSLGKSVEVIEFLDNDAYDELLSENLVFIDFYDTSANNAVIECIARGTPIVVCRHPAVVEYLGKDYPLYYSDYSEVPQLINDDWRVYEASLHMLNNPMKKKLHLECFVHEFSCSDVVRGAS